MGKKKFIDKKKAVTFRLVNRSQQDPLYVDETAPQHVLVPISHPSKSTSSSRPASSATQVVDKVKRKQEQAKYGIFYDDDYDYLQHLKEPGRDTVCWEPVGPTAEGKKSVSIQLPSSVFASEFEEEEGLMSKALVTPGPKPNWDPDVVAALDEDFDFENPDNQLDDDFIVQAMEGAGEEDDEYYDDDDDDEYSDVDSDDLFNEEDEEADKLGPLMREHDFENEEKKSRFTEYSMTSSVIRRNEQLSLLDDRFEEFFKNYDEPEIGALDCEEIEGHVEINDNVLLQYAEEYHKEKEGKYNLDYQKQWDKERILKLQEVSDDEDLVEMEVEDDKQKKWDCESILSTYSNIYNHPKLISEPRKRQSKIQINEKTGLPMNVLDGDNGKLTVKSLAKLSNEASQKIGPKSLCDGSVISTLSVLSIRPKDESLEEKRERKKLLKEYRNERRIERKANTLCFKEEKERQELNKINNRHNGKKIL